MEKRTLGFNSRETWSVYVQNEKQHENKTATATSARAASGGELR